MRPSKDRKHQKTQTIKRNKQMRTEKARQRRVDNGHIRTHFKQLEPGLHFKLMDGEIHTYIPLPDHLDKAMQYQQLHVDEIIQKEDDDHREGVKYCPGCGEELPVCYCNMCEHGNDKADHCPHCFEEAYGRSESMKYDMDPEHANDVIVEDAHSGAQELLKHSNGKVNGVYTLDKDEDNFIVVNKPTPKKKSLFNKVLDKFK